MKGPRKLGTWFERRDRETDCDRTPPLKGQIPGVPTRPVRNNEQGGWQNYGGVI